MKKFAQRIFEINDNALPQRLARARYVSRAVSVLGYLAQLATTPVGIHNISIAAIAKVLRYPGHALDHDTARSLDVLGGVKMVKLYTYMQSCMARTALTTLRNLPSDSAEAKLCLIGLLTGLLLLALLLHCLMEGFRALMGGTPMPSAITLRE